MKKITASLIAISLTATSCISTLAATYTVQKGDTLWKVANSHSIKLSTLLKANPELINPDIIYPGDVLTIPENANVTQNYEQEVLNLVNKHRSNYGLPPLSLDSELSNVAKLKSQDMKNNNYFSHTSPTYGSPFDMMKKFGISYRSAAENIAKGQNTPNAVVNAWMNSSGHRKNILSSSYTHMGVGYVKDGHYWTQMFIQK